MELIVGNDERWQEANAVTEGAATNHHDSSLRAVFDDGFRGGRVRRVRTGNDKLDGQHGATAPDVAHNRHVAEERPQTGECD